MLIYLCRKSNKIISQLALASSKEKTSPAEVDAKENISPLLSDAIIEAEMDNNILPDTRETGISDASAGAAF